MYGAIVTNANFYMLLCKGFIQEWKTQFLFLLCQKNFSNWGPLVPWIKIFWKFFIFQIKTLFRCPKLRFSNFFYFFISSHKWTFILIELYCSIVAFLPQNKLIHFGLKILENWWSSSGISPNKISPWTFLDELGDLV